MTVPIITQVRDDLVHALTEAVDVPVLTTLPTTLRPPALLVTEANPFIEGDDENPRSIVAHFDVIAVVAAKPDNAAMLADLDDLASLVLDRLWADYRITVGQYETLTLPNQQPYMSTRISAASTGWTIL